MAAAQQHVEAARQEAARSEREMKDYKARALVSCGGKAAVLEHPPHPPPHPPSHPTPSNPNPIYTTQPSCVWH